MTPEPEARFKPRIAALRARSSEATQELMASFALGLRRRGFSVAGVTQVRVLDEATGRRRIALRDLRDDRLYAIAQDLGPGSVACNLDSSELALACDAIERAARGGVDLIVLSKFAKQEASRGGLCDAFRRAMEAKTPVVAAIHPDFLAEWAAFAGPVAEFVEFDQHALEDWWRRARSE